MGASFCGADRGKSSRPWAAPTGPYTEKAGGEQSPRPAFVHYPGFVGRGLPCFGTKSAPTRLRPPPPQAGEGRKHYRSFFMYCRNGSSLSSMITALPSANEAR